MGPIQSDSHAEEKGHLENGLRKKNSKNPSMAKVSPVDFKGMPLLNASW